jgi:thymidylate synthase
MPTEQTSTAAARDSALTHDPSANPAVRQAAQTLLDDEKPPQRSVDAASVECAAGGTPAGSGRPVDTQYEDLLRRVLSGGAPKSDRTGTGTRSVFGAQLRYDLAAGFPLITTKRVHLKSVAYELFFFLQGRTDNTWLNDRGVHIWDEWAGPDGDLGPVYGAQWRSWATPDGGHIDQLAEVLHTLRTNPDSRRMVITAWNPADLPEMALPPCHLLYQFTVTNGRLNCHIIQRSADLFLGVPFNIASYALLTHLVALNVGLDVGTLLWTGTDVHIYDNHLVQVTQQLSRTPYPFPTLELRPAAALEDYDWADVSVTGYLHHPTIKAPVAV